MIARVLAGEELAFRELYRRHCPRLRMVIARVLATRGPDVEDVLQDTWLEVVRGLSRFEGRAQFATWLTTIGIRTARTKWRAQETDGSALQLLEARTPDSDLRIEIERLLNRLPGQQRAVMILHDLEGFKHEEIAAMLEIAPGTSKSALSRARTALRDFMEGHANVSR